MLLALLGEKNAEHRRIDAFEVWCWRRLLRVPWTARRSNQSILNWESAAARTRQGEWHRLHHDGQRVEHSKRHGARAAWNGRGLERDRDDSAPPGVAASQGLPR